MPTIPKYAKQRSIKPLIKLTAEQYLRFRILCMQDHKSMNVFLREVILEQIQRMPEIPLAHYGPHREDYGKPRPARRKKPPTARTPRKVKDFAYVPYGGDVQEPPPARTTSKKRISSSHKKRPASKVASGSKAG